MRNLYCFVLLALGINLVAQNPNKTSWEKVARAATIDLSEEREDLFPVLIYDETPDGNSRSSFLAGIKEEVERQFPRKIEDNNQNRGGSDAPQILQSIEGQNFTLGIPLDNHLAVSNSGDLVTVANFHIITYDEEGTLKNGVSLTRFSRDVMLGGQRFDPRIIYDPEMDRFIVAILAGFESDDTNIILAFSETNDPNGDWNLYSLPGNPFDLKIFSDYPMLSISKDRLYLTINAVHEDSTWQAGFVESYIWDVGKSEGYAGDSLDIDIWTEIKYKGKNIRNLCPVVSADDELESDMYFLSNRNFAIQNDTFFLVKLKSTGESEVRPVLSDVDYGVPPNARQAPGLLQTNDARVLDALLIDGEIQFAGNSVNPSNGLASVFYGSIPDAENSNQLVGQILENGDNEMGYPDLSYAGVETDDRHTFIVASHVSEMRNPGISAMAFDGDTFSDWISVSEGTGPINRLSAELERWGDYAGNQQQYSIPGTAWIVSSKGGDGGLYGITIARIARADVMVNVENEPKVSPSVVYPNPFGERISVEFNMPRSGKVTLDLHDQEGRHVYRFMNGKPKSQGRCILSFSALPSMASGEYILRVTTDLGHNLTKKIQYSK